MKTIGLCLLMLIQRVLTDLPIHCLNSQVAGVWKFEFTKSKSIVSAIQNNCGHDMPDSENTSLLAMRNSVMNAGQFTIELFENGSVDDITNFKKKNSNKSIGDIMSNNLQQKFRFMEKKFRLKTNYEKKKKESNKKEKKWENSNIWTMIYDEGFELKIDSVKILLFNQYFKQNGKWKSNCSNTLVGWYRDESDDTYGCIRGSMVNKGSQINDQQEGLLVVQNRVESKSIAKKFRYFRFKESYKKYTMKKLAGSNRKFNFKMDDRFKSKLQLNARFTEHQKVVDKLNSIKGKTWTAGVNKYFLTKTIAEINRMSGRMKKNNKLKYSQQQAANISQQYVNEDLSMFPKEWDWTKKLGYQPQIRSQEDCGSCYVISTMSMIDFRLKIKYPNLDIDRMSIQFAIDCSFYNQGCDGGYPSLVARFGHDVFLLEEKYKQYQGKNGVCKEFDTGLQDVQRTVKIGDYGYVGGRYGNSNTSNIMREIMTNGPVVLSFEPDYFFSLYTKGVYQKLEPSEWIDKGILRPEWIKIDHSVLCYGWGETEDGIKYWLLQNSWGDGWGQDGTFMMLRQKDEMGIESSAEFADPYIEDISKSKPQIEYLQKM